jgi:hypothetical protein
MSVDVMKSYDELVPNSLLHQTRQRLEERMGIHLSSTSCRVVGLAAAENRTSDESMSLAFGYMADSDYDRLSETDEMKRQSQ